VLLKHPLFPPAFSPIYYGAPSSELVQRREISEEVLDGYLRRVHGARKSPATAIFQPLSHLVEKRMLHPSAVDPASIRTGRALRCLHGGRGAKAAPAISRKERNTPDYPIRLEYRCRTRNLSSRDTRRSDARKFSIKIIWELPSTDCEARCEYTERPKVHHTLSSCSGFVPVVELIVHTQRLCVSSGPWGAHPLTHEPAKHRAGGGRVLSRTDPTGAA